MRARTDVAVPASYLLLPLASYLLWAVFVVGWWGAGAGLRTGDVALVVSVLGIVGLAASAAASYVVYTLMNRANKHFSRTRALLCRAIDELHSRIGTAGHGALLPLSSADESLYKLSRGEHERSAGVWALLASIPVIGGMFFVAALWVVSPGVTKNARFAGVVFVGVCRR